MLLLRGFLALLCALTAVLAFAGTAAGADPPRVLAVEFENDVNPVTADYLTGAIDQAENEDYDAVVILMDTPGGLDSAMRDSPEERHRTRLTASHYGNSYAA